MEVTQVESTGAHRVSASTQPARRSDLRFALGAVAVSAAIFLAAAPFARTPLPPVPAFIPTVSVQAETAIEAQASAGQEAARRK